MTDSQNLVRKDKARSNTAQTKAQSSSRGGQAPQEKAQGSQPAAQQIMHKTIQQTIELTAYYLALERHFEPGHDLEDWLRAEEQVRAEFGDSQGPEPRAAATGVQA